MITNAKPLLRKLGVNSTQCEITNFPTTFSPKLVPAWAEYLKTQVCFDLYERGEKDAASSMLLATLGFISHIKAATNKLPFLASVPPISITTLVHDWAILEYKNHLQEFRKEISAIGGLGQEFKTFGGHTLIDSSYNRLIGATVPTKAIIFSNHVLARDAAGKARNMNEVLARLRYHVFGGTLPKKLMSQTGIPVIGGDWPKLKELYSASSPWYTIREGIQVARAEGNVLVFRKFVAPNTIFFNMRDVSRLQLVLNRELQSS